MPTRRLMTLYTVGIRVRFAQNVGAFFLPKHINIHFVYILLHSTCLHCMRFTSILTTFTHLPADYIPSHFFTFDDILYTCTFEYILCTFSRKHIRHTLHARTTHLHTHSLWTEHIPVHSRRPPHYSAFRTSHIPLHSQTPHLSPHSCTCSHILWPYIRLHSPPCMHVSECMRMYLNLSECTRRCAFSAPPPRPRPKSTRIQMQWIFVKSGAFN